MGFQEIGSDLDNSRHSRHSLDRSSGRGSANSRSNNSFSTLRANDKKGAHGMGSNSNQDTRRQRKELIETPVEKHAFKTFQEAFRTYSKASSEKAQEFALSALVTCPEGIRWKIYLALADQARRMNDFLTARSYFLRASELSLLPHSAGWSGRSWKRRTGMRRKPEGIAAGTAEMSIQ